MTAVASPPSVQSGPRLGWYSTGNSGQGALTSMNADDVSRMFMPRKNLQRTNSSSSLASSSSSTSTSTISATPSHSNAAQGSNVESGTYSSKKKSSRGIWPSSKSEPVSGVTNARSQPVSASPSGPTASSAMSAIHQPSPVVPSQHMLQSPQTNGVRPGGGQASSDPPAILTLLPMNGTFERKQINVPFLPEVLRIGRQTNAKTVPTPANGFFDSKVLSRQHAEVWSDRNGKIWIRDVKSSNGTFVNGQRLSPENKDSDPHELREHDTLELGIDIVSEDQKSIVHHKVSAKVEHAGIYGSNPSILDLNFGDIDPTARGGLLPSPLSQPVPHMRGRPGSSASMGSSRSSQSAADNHMNLLHQQRQMNYWLSPITIEQVVKKLSTEMKQARVQAQDLGQTGGFLNSMITQDGLEKERPKPSPTESHNGPRQANGRPKMPKIDHLSRFSDPPAPPPQQPLPEKPDAPPRHSPSDQVVSHSPLRRSDTEKPKPSAAGGSPITREPSQILSLVEALAAAKKEIDSQGARVKELEDMLHRERSARECAEERAKKLELSPVKGPKQESEVEAAFEPPPELDDQTTMEESNDSQTLGSDRSETAVRTTEQPSEKDVVSQTAVSPADSLQHRLDAMVAEMGVMKQQLNEYKQRAETAEEEKVHARKTLAEMIEKYRLERSESPEDKSKGHRLEKEIDGIPTPGPDGALSSKKLGSLVANEPMPSNNLKELESAATAFAKQRHRSNVMDHSAPYASMLGVVLLGVGIMAYLNGWQKIEK